MKRTCLLFACIAMLVSCNTKKEPQEAVETTVEDVATTTPDGHNAQNALDYQGTYKGTLPTATGEDANVTITLTDSTYTKAIETPQQTKEGKYSWDESGSIITLEGDETPNKYFVGEKSLRQLDADGNKIEGETASKYFLRK